MKSSLQKALLQQKIKFQESKKKAKAAERELMKLEMAEKGQELHKNILMPKYELNAELKVYEEIDAPPKSIYMPVGYNDMQKVRVYMEGDDHEKRNQPKQD